MAPHAVPTAAVVGDWKDERMIVGEDDLDAMCGGLYALVNALEGEPGKVEGAKEDLAAAWAAVEEVDLVKAELTDKRLTEREEALDARHAAAETELASLIETLAALEPQLEKEAALWTEVSSLPALLKKHSERADFAMWGSRIDSARKQTERAAEQHDQAKHQAEELRTAYHVLLHKLSHLTTAAERMSTTTSDKKRRRDDGGSTASQPAKKAK